MKKKQTLYVALRHSDGHIIASKSKTAIAKHCGISYHTVWRHSSIDGPFNTNGCTIYYDVEYIKAR